MRHVLLAVALMLSGAPTVEGRTLCAAGDSITYGVTSGPEAPRLALPWPAALEALLRKAPARHPWRRARVRNYGLGGTWTELWVDVVVPPLCTVHPPDSLWTLACLRHTTLGVDPPWLPLDAGGIHLTADGAAALGGLWYGLPLLGTP